MIIKWRIRPEVSEEFFISLKKFQIEQQKEERRRLSLTEASDILDRKLKKYGFW